MPTPRSCMTLDMARLKAQQTIPIRPTAPPLYPDKQLSHHIASMGSCLYILSFSPGTAPTL
jgi:hypothetical protein